MQTTDMQEHRYRYAIAVLLLSAGFVAPISGKAPLQFETEGKETKILKSVILLNCHSTKIKSMSVQTQILLYRTTYFDLSQPTLMLTIGLLRNIEEEMYIT
jgi:hypothetical protein